MSNSVAEIGKTCNAVKYQTAAGNRGLWKRNRVPITARETRKRQEEELAVQTKSLKKIVCYQRKRTKTKVRKVRRTR